MIQSFTSALFLVLLTLSACAPDQDHALVTLLTPIGMNQKFHNLQKDFFDPMLTATATNYYCLENSIFVGTNDGIESKNIVNKKVRLFSDYRFVGGSDDITTWLRNNSYLEPVQINVLKGSPVDIGIIGAFYYPTDANSDGICDETASGGYAMGSGSIIGHQKILVSGPTTINMNIWAMETAPTSTPAPPTSGNPGGFSCVGGFSGDCAFRNFLKLETTSTTYCKITGVEYFYNSDHSQKISHGLNINPLSSYYYTPEISPLTIFYTDVLSSTQNSVTYNGGSSGAAGTASVLANCGTGSIQTTNYHF